MNADASQNSGLKPADTNKQTAILLLGFGGPEKLDQVRPFIEHVVQGRNVPPARVDAVVEQYKQIGGKSPYNELTMKQAAALKAALAAAGINAQVYRGMLHSAPWLDDTIKEMSSAGIDRAVGIIMAPHRSEASYEKYLKALDAALVAAPSKLHIEFIPQWHTQSLFAAAAAERIAEKLCPLPPDVVAHARVIFSAHSIPEEMSLASGYDRQIAESAQCTMDVLTRELPAAGKLDWIVGYQSRSGSPAQKWLEPDVGSRIAEAQTAGKTHVIVMPIGFLVDHVEVLYDLDILAAGQARELGMTMLRAATVGDHPRFIELLANLSLEKIGTFYANSERH